MIALIITSLGFNVSEVVCYGRSIYLSFVLLKECIFSFASACMTAEIDMAVVSSAVLEITERVTEQIAAAKTF